MLRTSATLHVASCWREVILGFFFLFPETFSAFVQYRMEVGFMISRIDRPEIALQLTRLEVVLHLARLEVVL